MVSPLQTTSRSSRAKEASAQTVEEAQISWQHRNSNSRMICSYILYYLIMSLKPFGDSIQHHLSKCDWTGSSVNPHFIHGHLFLFMMLKDAKTELLNGVRA